MAEAATTKARPRSIGLSWQPILNRPRGLHDHPTTDVVTRKPVGKRALPRVTSPVNHCLFEEGGIWSNPNFLGDGHPGT